MIFKPVKKKIVYVILFCTMLFVVLHTLWLNFYIPTTDGYKVAAEYLYSEKNLIAQTGAIRKITFIPFDYKYSYNGMREENKLRFSVEGERGSVRVLTRGIRNPNQAWQIVASHILKDDEGFPNSTFDFEE